MQLLREGEDFNAEQALARALHLARGLAQLDARCTPMPALMEESLICLREGIDTIAHYESNLEADPQRQEWVEQRLATLESIARKHRVDPGELPELRLRLEEEHQQLEALETSLERIDQRFQAAQRAFQEACDRLSAARTAAARRLSTQMTALMQTLGMPGGELRIDVRPLPAEAQGLHGADDIEFMVSANPGQPPKPLAKVASGGELSRISLAIQVAAVQDCALPCLVFDEVDAGIGGAVAEIVGRQLHALGERAQVLCVTHLPQVASQGQAHVRVTKLTDGKTTRTVLQTLNPEERVEEIARMLGGIDITEKARAHAAEMLRPASTIKTGAKKKARARTA
jgi:DNA repair protein RecN (Recombination protein N)